MRVHEERSLSRPLRPQGAGRRPRSGPSSAIAAAPDIRLGRLGPARPPYGGCPSCRGAASARRPSAMEFIQIEVREREERGTAAMNRIRRSGGVPAVLYGLQRRNLAPHDPRDGARALHPERQPPRRAARWATRPATPSCARSSTIPLDRRDPPRRLRCAWTRTSRSRTRSRSRYKGTAAGHARGRPVPGARWTRLAVTARPRDLPDEILARHLRRSHVGDAIYVRDVDAPRRASRCDLEADDADRPRGRRAAAWPRRTRRPRTASRVGEPEVIGKEAAAEASEG